MQGHVGLFAQIQHGVTKELLHRNTHRARGVMGTGIGGAERRRKQSFNINSNPKLHYKKKKKPLPFHYLLVY